MMATMRNHEAGGGTYPARKGLVHTQSVKLFYEAFGILDMTDC